MFVNILLFLILLLSKQIKKKGFGKDRSLKLKSINMRDIITLECTECKRRNYTTTKNKRNHPGRVEYKKYCRWDKKHTIHKETK